MTETSNDLHRRITVLEERIARLSAAALRINSSLELDKVLQEVVDSACALTNAELGAIVIVDDHDMVEEFVTFGFTESDKENMLAWSDGPQLFQHLRDLREPLRVSDLPSYVRSLGFSDDLMKSRTMQGTPLFHRDVYLGSFFIASKEDNLEFTDSDEELLKTFASQAATAIANARTYRNEQRARNDIETLLETSPVGVVVFDGKTGAPISINRETRRIFERLWSPGQTPEQLLDTVICHRSDGHVRTLATFPMSAQMSSAETIRAEEMTLAVPDGRRVTALVNATPIWLPDGSVQSMVVTLQDLEALHDVARMRAEILTTVSEELRTPLISIKGSTATVLSSDTVPAAHELLQFIRVIDEQADQMRSQINELLEFGRSVTGTLDVEPKPVEVAPLVQQGCVALERENPTRDLNIVLPDNLPLVMTDPSRAVHVMSTLMDHASKYSPGSSPIEVSARLDDMYVVIAIKVRNWQIPANHLAHIYNRLTQSFDYSEEGLQNDTGFDFAICRGIAEACGGRLWAEEVASQNALQISFTSPIVHESITGAGITTGEVSRVKTGQKSNVLVVTDDPHSQRFIRDTLTQAGYAAIVIGDSSNLIDDIGTHDPVLVLLDMQVQHADDEELQVTLPDADEVPVILIAQYGKDETVETMLDMGIADYIVKPFSPSELLARIRATIHRQSSPVPFRLGDLSIDYTRRQVTVKDQVVELTATEYELLRVLSASAGRVQTYDTLLRKAWGKRSFDSGDPKVVRAVVKRLRAKLGDDATHPSYVRNERGVGYSIPHPDGL